MHGAANGGLSARYFLGHPTERSGLCGNSSSILQAWDCRNELLAECSCPKGLCKELGGWLTAWERSHSKAEENNFSSSGVVLMFHMHFFSLNEDENFKWKNKF